MKSENQQFSERLKVYPKRSNRDRGIPLFNDTKNKDRNEAMMAIQRLGVNFTLIHWYKLR